MNHQSSEAAPARPLRIAMLGMRGVPANYGGLETVAEEVGARLVERGHAVAVYCRTRNSTDVAPTYRGMRRIVLPSLPHKFLDTPSHTTIALLHALLHRSDLIHVFGVGNAAWLPLARLGAKRTVISVDGMDWRRRKWGRIPRFLLERSSAFAVRAAGACITDSREVAQYYEDNHGRRPVYISHGVATRPVVTAAALERYGLADRGYALFVGRITPEKGVHHLIDAFAGVPGDMRLVIVGDGSAERSYWQTLQASAAADERVMLLGPVYGQSVRELFAHAYVYVQPSEVEGTALSLVEAMGYGNCVVVSNIPENVETVGSAGIAFDASNPVASLRQCLRALYGSPEEVQRRREAARAHAREHYSWERVTDAHEALYYEVLGSSR